MDKQAQSLSPAMDAAMEAYKVELAVRQRQVTGELKALDSGHTLAAPGKFNEEVAKLLDEYCILTMRRTIMDQSFKSPTDDAEQGAPGAETDNPLKTD